MPDSKLLPPRRRITRLPEPPARRAPVFAAVATAALLACAGFYFALRRPERPAPAPAPEPAAPAPPPRATAAEAPRLDPLDELLATARTLIDGRRYGEAMRRLDDFPARQSPRRDAEEKIAALRADAESKARDLCSARAHEAETLATAGKLREAVDRLADLAELDAPSLLAPAFDRLRGAADRWLAARRTESRARVEKELADLAARYEREVAAADPDEAWKLASAMIDAGDWASAIAPLTRLAKRPEWRERALSARSRAHYACGQFAGVLLDAQLMIDAGVPAGRALAMLPRAVTRAPIDEPAQRLYERAVEKQPLQADAWVCLAILHTWRHDAAAAARVTDRAIDKRVRFDGDAIFSIDDWRRTSFPAYLGLPRYPGAVSIATVRSVFRLRRITLVPLSGPGRILP